MIEDKESSAPARRRPFFRPVEEMRARAAASFGSEAVLALVLAALSFVVRLAIDPYLHDRQPYTPAFAAIAFAVWFGGWRAGAICTIASQLLANYFFIAPRNQFTVGFTELVSATSYYFTAAIIVYLGHRARRANSQLAREAAQKDLFIATLSHELRNPLAPIVNAAQLLARADSADETTRRAVGMVQRQAHHMTRLLDDLLDLSRITQGRLELRHEPVDLRLCVRDAAETVRDLCVARGQSLAIDLPAEPVPALGDATRITQIVANLLNNAAKYSPAGARIDARVRSAGDQVEVVVRDNGPGIDAEALPDLFDAFNKREPRSARPTNGLGIGLWLANRLAIMHGGRITVESRPGAGSTFTVRLLALPHPA